MRKSRTGKKEGKQDQDMEQCHTSRDVLRKVPREQCGEFLEEPPAPSRSINTRHCVWGNYKQDISLERIPELL